jgi:hypothetical protein
MYPSLVTGAEEVGSTSRVEFGAGLGIIPRPSALRKKERLEMTKAMRWRIILLQVVALLVLIGAAGGAYYGSTFANDQIKQQLEPQLIQFPSDMSQVDAPYNLPEYAGKYVTTGDQARAYAEGYIAKHLKEIGTDKATGQSHPYSWWSGQAIADRAAAGAATDPTTKAQLTAKAAAEQGTADTLFKGETLRSMLNQAWTFSVIAQLGLYGAIGMALAALLVFGTLVFEALEAVRGMESVVVVPASELREPAGIH